jgi:CHAT domain-containing protein
MKMYAKLHAVFLGFQKWFVILLSCSLIGVATSAVANELLQGENFFQQGAFAKAIERWEAVLKETDPNSDSYLEILLRLTNAYQAVGNYTMARATIEQAQHHAENGGTLKQQIWLQSLMGDVLLAMQQPDAAKTLLQNNVERARTLNDPVILAHLLNNFGNALYVLQEYFEAQETYQEVSQLAQHSGDKTLYIQALNNQVSTHLKQDHLQSALTTFNMAVAKIQKWPNHYDKGFQLLSLGQIALRLQKYQPEIQLTAYQLFTQALQVAEQHGDSRLKAYAKGLLGQIYEQRQRYQEALQLTRQAIFFAQDFPDILYLWEWQQARLLQAQQNLPAARKAYQQALKHLEPIKTRLFIGQRDTLAVLYERIRPVYLGFADLLLQQAATSPTTMKQDLLKQARDKIEDLKMLELQEYFQDECISAIGVPTTEIEQSLDNRTAVLYPILLAERTELLLSFASGIHQVVVPIGAEKLSATVHEWRSNLQFSTSPRFIKQSKQLYEWLITPIKDKLTAQNINTLVIVPEGPLRTVPLAALYDASTKKFLIHHFALAITPGLNLTDARPFPRKNLLVLLNGLSEGVQNFSPLPSVPKEINNIDGLFDKNDVLLDKRFLLTNFSKTLQKVPYEMIHIASHGQFDRNPKKTFLLTYDEKLTMDRLQNLLGFSQFRKKPVELLTLSACQTAVGDERAALGLAGVAIKAGSRSAIASLWFVNDESTSQLIADFYQNLMQNPTWSKAKALQQAQQKIMTTQAFRHPAYWSPFLLIGNWL